MTKSCSYYNNNLIIIQIQVFQLYSNKRLFLIIVTLLNILIFDNVFTFIKHLMILILKEDFACQRIKLVRCPPEWTDEDHKMMMKFMIVATNMNYFDARIYENDESDGTFVL